MPEFIAPQSHIHVIVRLILLQGDAVVLCRLKGQERFFLPGGHIEDGELAQEALKRELKEELGITEYGDVTFAGLCEGMFPHDFERDIWEHQINLVFETCLEESQPIISQEDHIEFIKVNKSVLEDCVIMPKPMRDGMMEWFVSRKPFYRTFRD